MFEDEEIEKSRREEERDAGRKSKPRKLDSKLLEDVKRAFRRGSERESMQALRRCGISDESPKFAEMVKLFRESRGPS